MADTTGEAYEINRPNCDGYCATHCRTEMGNATDELVVEIHKMVTELHETVYSLMGSIDAAKNSGGMSGIMARQMFPDMTPIATNPE